VWILAGGGHLLRSRNSNWTILNCAPKTQRNSPVFHNSSAQKPLMDYIALATHTHALPQELSTAIGLKTDHFEKASGRSDRCSTKAARTPPRPCCGGVRGGLRQDCFSLSHNLLISSNFRPNRSHRPPAKNRSPTNEDRQTTPTRLAGGLQFRRLPRRLGVLLCVASGRVRRMSRICRMDRVCRVRRVCRVCRVCRKSRIRRRNRGARMHATHL
jgi:hypothetical protein